MQWLNRPHLRRRPTEAGAKRVTGSLRFPPLEPDAPITRINFESPYPSPHGHQDKAGTANFGFRWPGGVEAKGTQAGGQFASTPLSERLTEWP
jgi:hypothetical protein